MLPPLSDKAPCAHLGALDNSVERLQKFRQEAQEDLLEMDKEERTEKDVELQLLLCRMAYFENEMEHGRRGHRENPSTVGHLQQIGSTRAYVLFPNVPSILWHQLIWPCWTSGTDQSPYPASPFNLELLPFRIVNIINIIQIHQNWNKHQLVSWILHRD